MSRMRRSVNEKLLRRVTKIRGILLNRFRILAEFSIILDVIPRVMDREFDQILKVGDPLQTDTAGLLLRLSYTG